MEQKNTLFLLVIVLTTLACNALFRSTPAVIPTASIQPNVNPSFPPDDINTPQPEIAASETVSPPQNSGGLITLTPTTTLCSHDYYPITGGPWVYHISEFPLDPNRRLFALQVELHNVRTDGFSIFTKEVEDPEITIEDDPLATSLEVICLPEGLASELSGPGGVFLPKELQAGSTWKEGIGTAVETIYTSLGVESVTVFAGTYDAIKVKAVVSSKEDETIFRWYAKGVGLVKTYIEKADGWYQEDLILTAP
jgi:hypothetical protein